MSTSNNEDQEEDDDHLWRHFRKLRKFQAECNTCKKSFLYVDSGIATKHFEQKHPHIKTDKIENWKWQYFEKLKDDPDGLNAKNVLEHIQPNL